MRQTLERLALRLKALALVRFAERSTDEGLAEVVKGSPVKQHCSVAAGWEYSALGASVEGVSTTVNTLPGITDADQNGVSDLLPLNGNLAVPAQSFSKLIQAQSTWRGLRRSWVTGFPREWMASEWDRANGTGALPLRTARTSARGTNMDDKAAVR